MRRGTVLIVLGLAGLLVVLALLLPRWVRLLKRPLPGAEGEARTEEAQGVERQINVKLFFQASDRRGLAVEERTVAYSGDLARQVRVVVQELVKGPRAGLLPTLAPQARVLEVFVSPRGVAYVDLSREAAQVVPGGSEAEMATVYSVVNTLTSNFPALTRVQILIEDRPVATLAGHVDLTRPLPPDMTQLAGAVEAPPAPVAPQ